MYIIIVGCGRVGSELAKLLSGEGNDVVILDKDEKNFARLGETFNGVTVKGNGVSPKILQDAGIEKADVFCAFTNSDSANIMASQVAKGIFRVPRVIARVYDPKKAAIYQTFGLDVLSEPFLFASMIRDKIIDKRLSSYLIETSELGILEIPVHGEMAEKSVGQINLPGELLVTTIVRKKMGPIIPDLKTAVNEGDTLLAVVKMSSLDKVNKMFNL